MNDVEMHSRTAYVSGALLTVLILMATAMVFRTATVPVVGDEVGYLAIARYLVTGDILNVSAMAPYRFGQGLLLTPAVWFGTSPEAIYRWGVLLSCLATALVPLVLIGISRNIGIRTDRTVIFTAALVTIFPTYFYQMGLVWPEATFRLFFLVALLLIAVAWQRRKAAFWVLASADVVWLYALHPRALGLLAVFLLVTFLATVRRRIGPAGAALCCILTVGGFYAVGAIQAEIAASLWPGRDGDTGHVLALFGRMPAEEIFTRLLFSSLGQAWMLVAASFGMIVAGAFHAYRLSQSSSEARIVCLFAAFGMLSVFAASVLQMAAYQLRADHIIYSRYNDGTSTFFVWLGLVYVAGLGGRTRAFGYAAAALGAFAVPLWMMSTGFVPTEKVMPNIPVAFIADYVLPVRDALLSDTVKALSIAVGLVLLAMASIRGKSSLLVLVAAVAVTNFSISQSKSGAHVARKTLTDQTAAVLALHDGPVHLDRSATTSPHIYFDQFASTPHAWPWSDVLRADIPAGHAAIVGGAIRKEGYTCVARLPYDAVLLARGPASALCGGMDQPPVRLEVGVPVSLADIRNTRGEGWSHVEAWGRWTEGTMASLFYQIEARESGLVLELQVAAYTAGEPPGQRVGVTMNGVRQQDWTFDAATGRVLKRINLPAHAEDLEIEFDLPDARSPLAAGASTDPRVLGIGVTSVCLAEAAAPCLR